MKLMVSGGSGGSAGARLGEPRESVEDQQAALFPLLQRVLDLVGQVLPGTLTRFESGGLVLERNPDAAKDVDCHASRARTSLPTSNWLVMKPRCRAMCCAR